MADRQGLAWAGTGQGMAVCATMDLVLLLHVLVELLHDLLHRLLVYGVWARRGAEARVGNQAGHPFGANTRNPT